MLTEPAPQTMRLSLTLTLLLLGAWGIPGGLGDRAPLTATAPQLDDEEKYSAHMPAHLRCDACRAVAYQMWQHLAKAEAKLHTRDSGGQQELSESVYTDILDQSCSQTWQGYGVREVNQVKRLTGPGLSKGPEPNISVMITGGPWPTRLSMTCLHYLGEFGEDQIYEAHQQGREALEALLCGGPQGACSEEAPVTKTEL
ncbi:marginal zone B- and B1-cell-specific protein [Panthera pardus]|nr:marginal zone B- and B1-cell-specific protein [Panthera tigris]XP_019279898.1 marginal zone B- and B1-cell-specific protein [Panthera pardus]XP_049505282.1 marginal zone B- and B1-cell-specific protein [Panthera uncia]XP_058591199.1 marginal zone B- and B1-cell-specific protein [Neofelis nebulosa]XP_060493837.1 marginal zone B- and B1-cell-specific protein [Panthera onca]